MIRPINFKCFGISLKGNSVYFISAGTLVREYQLSRSLRYEELVAS